MRNQLVQYIMKLVILLIRLWTRLQNQYTKDLLTKGKGKPKLIQLVYDMLKNKESYVGHIIDHTPGSCCQRGSTCSEQNHSSVLAFIGMNLLVNKMKYWFIYRIVNIT